MHQEEDWFIHWFDSPYYHTLYKNRDEKEAHTFIDQLLAELSPVAQSRILDLACGRGRYSRYLADKGYEVTGVDLSPSSIAYAQQFERENLSFFVHDMRTLYRTNYFDYIFNFFTSFGYFHREKDEVNVLKNVARGLKPSGVFVLDFFNSRYVRNRLMGSDNKTIDGIHFKLHKWINHHFVHKSIDIDEDGQVFHFEEKVRLYELSDFQRLFSLAGLTIAHTYGNYQLSAFDENESPRLIIVSRKI
ncbi:MAG: class I SAM-dependent methyltransferase [Saprospiraceae bacterium]|nr:class I SAM-dependent methyltransferase [Saprospiraceae bacterium]